MIKKVKDLIYYKDEIDESNYLDKITELYCEFCDNSEYDINEEIFLDEEKTTFLKSSTIRNELSADLNQEQIKILDRINVEISNENYMLSVNLIMDFIFANTNEHTYLSYKEYENAYRYLTILYKKLFEEYSSTKITNNYVKSSKKIKEMKSDIFGEAEFDEENDEYKFELDDIKIYIDVTLCEEEDYEEILNKAENVYLNRESCIYVIANSLIELKNECWNNSDENIGAEEFAEKLSLAYIVIKGDEREVYIEVDDGNMFGGHTIYSSFDWELNLISADI